MITRRSLVVGGAGIVAAPRIARAGLLMGSTGGGGGGTFVHTMAQTTDTFTVQTSAINTVGANIYFVSLTVAQTGGGFALANFSDTASNNWGTNATLVRTASITGSNQVQFVVYISPATGASYQLTYNNGGTPGYCCLGIIASSGYVATDDSIENSASGATTIQPGSITPAAGSELFVTCFGSGSPNPYSIDTGFTISNQLSGVAATAYGGAMAYFHQGGTGAALNPTWTSTVSDLNTVMGTFQGFWPV